MKAFLFLLCILLQSRCPAQDEKKIENQLATIFAPVKYWAENKIITEKTDGNDSLEKYNSVFLNTLLKYTALYPQTLHYAFEGLKDSGINITNSEDGLFRIYDWDTYTGGTMHFFKKVYQYAANGKVFSKIPADQDEEGNPGSYCNNIFSVQRNSKTVYIASFYIVGSTIAHAQFVQGFTIEQNKLNDTVKIFKTKTGLHNTIEFDYDYSTLPAAMQQQNSSALFYFDKNTRILQFPVIGKQGTVTSRFIRYQFNGNYFEKL